MSESVGSEINIESELAIPTIDTTFTAIVAVAENGVIGRDGAMPWHIPEDLAHFREKTMGHPVIMGRVTYESIVDGLGEPLPGRTSIVLTNSEMDTPVNVITASNIGTAIAEADICARGRHSTDQAFVAGGASIYTQLLPAVDRLVVTRVHDEPCGDAYFPDWDRSEWTETARDEHEDYSFIEYERPSE